MSQIIIQLQGGLVQDVFICGTGKPSDAIVVNEDVEGADAKEITTVKITTENTSLGKGTFDYEACIHTEGITKLPKDSDVDKIITKYLKGL